MLVNTSLCSSVPSEPTGKPYAEGSVVALEKPRVSRSDVHFERERDVSALKRETYITRIVAVEPLPQTICHSTKRNTATEGC